MKYLSGKRIKVLLSVLSAVFILLSSASAEDAGIEFNLESGNCGEKQVYATTGTAVLTASADGINQEKIKWDSDPAHLFPRMQGKNLTTGWAAGGYWLIEFSSTGMENLKLSANMYSSGKGPGYFELYFSTDGTNYTKIDNSAVELTQSPVKVYNEFPLPSAMNSQSKVYLKIEMCSDLSVKGNSITSIKDGSTYINNIVISCSGEPSEPSLPSPSPESAIKVYYQKGINIEFNRLGTQTGKYHFSVPIYNGFTEN